MDREARHQEIFRRLDRLDVWAFGPTEENGARGAIDSLQKKMEAVLRSIWIATGAMIILQPLLIAALVRWLV